MNWQPSSRYVATEKESAKPDVFRRIENLYAKPFSQMEAPEKFRFKILPNGEPEFRTPKCSEWALNIWLAPDTGWDSGDYDRLILEPIPEPPTPKRYVIVLEETGEVRNPESGEFFIGDNGKPCFADRRFLVLRFPILRVVSREAK